MEQAITEVQGRLNAALDELYALGFDHGWAVVMENLHAIADTEWNKGNTEFAEQLRIKLNDIEQDEQETEDDSITRLG